MHEAYLFFKFYAWFLLHLVVFSLFERFHTIVKV